MKYLGLLFLLIICLSLPSSAQAATYYSSATGSGTTCSIGSPCDLQAGLDKLAAGDTLLVRSIGGTYNGKFTISTSGSSGSRITIQAYPSEWPLIDGFLSTTLNGAINSSTTTIVLTSGVGFPNGFVITFHDGTEGSEEQVMLGGKSGNTYSSCTRAWNGTTAVSHSNGATIILGGNQFDVSGSFLTFKNLTITNTDPTRIQTPANSQNAPHLRGESFFNTGDNNQFINCVVSNMQDGIFNGPAASGPEIYGCLFYNNGYVAGGAYNGHGLYLIHEDGAATANVKENIIFNNSNHGIKGDSQNGSTINIFNEGNISFNTGAWTNGSSRNFNILMSTNNGTASGITVKDNFTFHPDGKNGTNLKLNMSGGSLSVTGNWIAHGIPVDIANSTPLTFTGNNVRGTNNSGGGNNTIILHIPAASPSTTWNSNSYFNSITSGLGYYFDTGSSNLSFSQWKTNSGFDGSTTETLSAPGSNWTFARANIYDANRANAIVYNWTGGTTATVSVAGVFNNGDTIAIHVAEEGTFPAGTPTSSVVVSGGNITVPMNGTSVVSQVGSDGSIIVTPITMRPTFAAFVLYRTAQVAVGSTVSGKATLSGKAKIN